MRLGNCEGALAALDCLSVDSLSHQYAAEFHVLRAYNFLQLFDERLESALTDARARAFSSGFRAVECEVEYVAAYAAWTSGDSQRAIGAVDALIEIGSDAPQYLATQRADYIYSTGYWQSRAYDLRGLIDAGREDYDSQAAALASAFVEFERGQVDDVYVESRMLFNLAVLVRDLNSDLLASYVEARAAQLAWNAATLHQEFAVYQALGIYRARLGDHLGAFRHFRRSASAAPSVPERIKAILDKSFLARELGEALSAQDDLDYALRLAKQTDWEDVSGNDRATLYELARHLAPTDTANARRLWERYVSLKSSISPLQLSARGDRRQRADECSALASVLLHENDRKRAISLFLESFEIWASVGYKWRAAILAVELAELTGEARYARYAEAEARKQPNSWLAKRVALLTV